MAATDRFTRAEILRLLDVTDKQLEYWERLQLVRRRRGQRFYNFHDLISLRTVKQLTGQGVPAHRLRRAIAALEKQLATVQAPLSELRILSNGRDVIVEKGGTRLEPLSGQFVLNFETRELGDKVRVIPERTADEWFALALELESDPETRAEAIDAYRRALEKNPRRMQALFNLGTLLYEQEHFEAAVACFRHAIDLEPNNPLAHYNIGCVLEEIDRLPQAKLHLESALRIQPDYSDACYNLALVCEKLGAYDEARTHWRKYIELDPASPWCDFARQRLTTGTVPPPPSPRPRRPR